MSSSLLYRPEDDGESIGARIGTRKTLAIPHARTCSTSVIFPGQRSEHAPSQAVLLRSTTRDQSTATDFPEAQETEGGVSDTSAPFNRPSEKVSVVKAYQYTEAKVEEVVARINEQHNRIYTRLDDQRDTLTALNVQMNILNETIGRIVISIDGGNTHQNHFPTVPSTVLPKVRCPFAQISIPQISAFSRENQMQEALIQQIIQ